jgi:hypothetical protein
MNDDIIDLLATNYPSHKLESVLINSIKLLYHSIYTKKALSPEIKKITDLKISMKDYPQLITCYNQD